ncbi:MAG TPA: heavy-metal-associated domain-containing protein [Ktedonobacteraceae bacterium]|jgi:copper chaperone|nr:heavy-metal-associated domain-containing protein [Ktedonobacteraceae bacterium]
MANVQDIVLSVPDVSCEHCVRTINGALGALTGVETVATDIPTKSVRLRYDSSELSMEQIEATLDDAGYTVAKEPRPAPRTSGKPLGLL